MNPSSSFVSRTEFEDFVNEVNSRFDQVRAEFVDMKREQIDLARQNNKVCIVLSGNSVRYQKNAKSAFIGIAWKAFGVRVGIFDLQIVHYLDAKSENSPRKLIAKFKKTGPNSAFWKLLNNSKNNVRRDKSIDVWANLKKSRYDNLLFWACRKLKSFGTFSKVEEDFISGKVRVKVTGKTNFNSVGHEDDIFALITEEDKEKLFQADTKNQLGHSHLKHMQVGDLQ